MARLTVTKPYTLLNSKWCILMRYINKLLVIVTHSFIDMRKKILSLNITNGSYSFFINQIIKMASLNKSSYVCVSNVHMCIESYWDKEFANQVNSADLVFFLLNLHKL